MHLFQKITETIPSGIYVFNLKLNINTYINASYTRILGYSLDELNAMGSTAFFDLYHPEDKNSVKEHLKSIIDNKTLRQIDYRIKHKNGH